MLLLASCGGSNSDDLLAAPSTADLVAPTLSVFTITSSAGAVAGVGDSLTINLTASEAISQPTLAVDGVADSFSITGSGTTWVGRVTLSQVTASGSIRVTATIRDIAGNNAIITQLSTPTAISMIVGQTPSTAAAVSSLVVTNASGSGTAPKVGDRVVVSFSSGRDIETPPQVMIGGSLAVARVSGAMRSQWMAEFVVDEGFLANAGNYQVAVVLPGAADDGSNVGASGTTTQISTTPTQLQSQTSNPFLLAPILSYAYTSVSLYADTPASIRLVNGGGIIGSSGCKATSLPPGLSLAPSTDRSTCEISGSPDGVAMATSFSAAISAGNNSGEGASLALTFIVLPAESRARPPSLSDVGSQVFVVGETIGSLSLPNLGGPPSAGGCTSDKALPNGLALGVSANGDSCQISGRPTAATGADNYVITATNANGSDNSIVSITVTAALAAPVLPGTPIETMSVAGVFASGLIIPNTGGRVHTCQFVSPPNGAYVGSFRGLFVERAANGRGCEVSGTLSALGEQRFTVYASNSAGNDETTLVIMVLPAPPNLVEPASVEAIDGVAMSPLAVVNTGGDASGCHFIDPQNSSEVNTLDGLSIAVASNGDCTITGSLSGVGMKEFRVLARNAVATDDATIRFQVKPALPALQPPGNLSFVTGAQRELPLVNTGGGGLHADSATPTPGCASTPALPSGLTVARSGDGNSCVISGAAETAQASAPYTIVATNETGSGQVVVNLETLDGAPVFAAPSTLSISAGQMVEELYANTNSNGGRVSACTATMLPEGLMVAAQQSPGNGCVLSGRALPTPVQGNFVITATNNGGSAQFTIPINVSVEAPDLPNLTTIQDATRTLPFTPLIFVSSAGPIESCFLVDGRDVSATELTMLDGMTVEVHNNGRSCRVFGALAIDSIGERGYIVRARNVTGADDATFAFNVAQVELPLLMPSETVFNEDLNGSFQRLSLPNVNPDPRANLLAAGCVLLDQSDAPLPINSDGLTYTTQGFTLSTDLPSDACEINSTLDTVGRILLRIRVDGAEGSGSIIVLSFVVRREDVLTFSASEISKTVGDPPFTQAATATSGETSFTWMSSDPTVASVDPATGELSLISSGMTTITATRPETDEYKEAQASYTLIVAPAAPDLPDSVTSESAIDGEAIDPVSLANAGGAAASCAFVDGSSSEVPTLHGLAVVLGAGGASCEVTGSLDLDNGSSQDFTVRATNATGSDEAGISFAVAVSAPDLPDSVTSESAIDGEAIDPVSLANAGGAAASCAFVDGSSTEVPTLHGLAAALGAGGASCEVTGALDLDNGSSQDFTVRATNATGSDEAGISFAVAVSAPDLPDSVTSESAIDGEAIDPVSLANAGGAAASCAFVDGSSSEVPTLHGLAVALGAGGASCEVTGSLDLDNGSSQDFTVRATNATGSDEAGISFAVAVSAPDLPDSVTSESAIDGQAIDPVSLANAGGAAASCAFVDGSSSEVPTLHGLAVALGGGGASCEVTGSLNLANGDSQDFTVRATNATGNDEAGISFSVAPAAPDLPDADTAASAIDGQAIDPVSLVNAGGATDSCAFVDGNGGEVSTLHGLTVALGNGGASCEITGSLMLSNGSSQSFTVHVTNVTGDDDATVTFAVVAASVPSLSAPQSMYEVDIDAMITTVTIANGNTAAVAALSTGSCQLLDDSDMPLTVASDLSYSFQGLVLTTDALGNQCEVSGTPDTRGRNTLRIRASGAQGASNILVLVFIVRDEDTVSFAPTELAVSKVVGDVPFTNAATATSGGTTFSWGSSSPAVATVDAVTGEVTIIAAGTTTITATRPETDEYKEASASYQLTVAPAAPDLPDSVTSESAIDGEAIDPVSLANAGGAAASCAFVDDSEIEVPTLHGLAAALGAGGASCEVTGALDLDNGSSQDFTVRATNATGNDEADITFAVAVSAPDLPDSVTSESAIDGEAIDPVSLANAGGAAASCAFVDGSSTEVPTLHGLAAALGAGGASCEVTGALDLDNGSSQTFTVRATNATGNDEADVSFAVAVSAPDLPDADTAASAVDGEAIDPVSLANAGGAAASCAFVDGSSTEVPTLHGLAVALGAGGASCDVTGALDLDNGSSQDFTVRATNATGDDEAGVSFAVAPTAPDLPDSVTSESAIDGEAIDPVSLANAGGAAASCAFVDGSSTEVSSLHGLAVALGSGGASCDVTGALDLDNGSSQDFTVRATNATGNDEADITFAVAVSAPDLPDADTAASAVDGQAIDPVSLANAGGAAASCAFVDGSSTEVSSLHGLAVALGSGGASCEVTGTLALANGASQSFTVRATNATGEDEADIAFAVVAASVPSLTAPQSVYEVDIDAMIAKVVLSNGNLAAAAALGAGACQLLDGSDVPLTVALDMSYSFQGLVLTTNTADNQCEVSGDPDTRGRSTLRIRATGSQGAGNIVEIVFIVRDEDVVSFAPTDLAVSKVVGDVPFTNAATATSGGTTFSWGSSSPAVATVDAVTGEVTIIAAGTTTITATRPETDEYKEASASYQLTVAPAAPDLPATDTAASAIDGEAIDPVSLANAGGAAASCAFVDGSSTEVPTLDGLAVALGGGGASCEVTGALDLDNGSSQTFTVRATNATGSDEAGITFAVAVSAPDLPDSVTSESAVDGEAIDPVSLANAGGAAASCAFVDGSSTEVPTLDGLAVALGAGGASCEVTGALALANGASQTFTVRATNATGSDEADVSFAVAVSAPDLPDSVTSESAIDGEAIDPVSLANAGGAAASCAFVDGSSTEVPTLDGLAVALGAGGASCEVTGALDLDNGSSQDFTVRATNATGSDEADVSFAVAVSAPDLPDSVTSESAVDGEAIDPVSLANAGGAAASCAFVDGSSTEVPTLDGLAVALGAGGASCEVTGALDLDNGSSQDFTVRATNATGSDEADITFAVAVSAPDLPDSVTSESAVDGEAIDPVSLANAGGAAASCAFVDGSSTEVPTLDGLAVALGAGGASCEVTGALDLDNGSSQDFTVRATNATGSDEADITFAVAVSAPDLPATDTAASAIDGEAIDPVSLANAGGAAASCAFVDGSSTEVPTLHGLAAALGAGGASCEVTGSLALANGASQTFTVRATNATGSDEADITFAVAVSAPDLPDSVTSESAVDGEAIDPVSLANAGGAAASCAFVDGSSTEVSSLDGLAAALGSGGASCEVTGSLALAGGASQTFTVRATNATGSDEADVSFAVAVSAPDLPDADTPASAVDGEAIDPVSLANAGGAAASCAFVDGSSTEVPTLDGLAAALGAGGASCEVTGALDLDNGSSQDFTVRATNATGSDEADVTFAVAPAAPDLPDSVTSESAIDGQAIDPVSLANAGGAAASCAFVDGSSTEVPTLDGLAAALGAGGASCEVTGGLDLDNGSSQDFTVRATNATGSDEADITFAVAVSAPDLPDADTAASTVDGEAIDPVSLANAGGAAASCAFVDGSSTEVSSLDGLAVALGSGGASCEVTGTLALAGGASQTFTVRATNATGNDEADIIFTVVAASVPSLTAPQSVYEVDVDATITMVVLSNGNPAAAAALGAGACQLLDGSDMPLAAEVDMSYAFQGLVLTTNTADNQCEVSGDPDTRGRSTLRIRATGSQGAGNIVEIVFIVRDEDVVSFAPTELMVSKVVGDVAFTNAAMATSGGTTFSWGSSSPAVATVDAVTGEVTIIAAGTTTITATRPETDEYKEASASYQLSVAPAAPDLPDAPTMVSAIDGQGIMAVSLANSGGAATGCVFVDGSDEVAMLDGLDIALGAGGASCEVSGALDLDNGASQAFTVRASNVTGDDDADLSFAVRVAATPALVLPGAEELTLTVDVAIVTPIELDNGNSGSSGAAIVAGGCRLLDGADEGTAMEVSAVSGLEVATGTDECLVSGTPDMIGMVTLYVEATSVEGGVAVLAVTITVVDAVPVIALVGAASRSFYTDEQIDAIAFTSSGGAITGCGSSPGLPGSLAIDMNSCEITGVIDDPITVASQHTITASNSGGDSVGVAISILAAVPPAPMLVYSGQPASFTVDVQISDIVISNALTEARSAIDSCALDASSPTLPAGLDLSVVGNTCTISGTPTAVAAAADYIVVALNAAGEESDAAMVRFTVNPEAPVFDADSYSVSATRGGSITATTMGTTGGDASSCGFVDALASDTAAAGSHGLSVAVVSGGCELSGMPLGTLTGGVGESFTLYVRVANDGGEDWAEVELDIDPAAPVFGADSYSVSATRGGSITATTMGTTGGDASGCGFVDALASDTAAAGSHGLSVAVVSGGCELSGMPVGTLTGGMGESFTLYVRVANDGGVDWAEVELDIDPAAPVLPVATVEVDVVDGQSFVAPVTVDNTGGPVQQCRFVDSMNVESTALDGLTIVRASNGVDCQITGALVGVGINTYTVRATNAGGSDEATVEFDVAPAAPDLSDAAAVSYYAGEESIEIDFVNGGGAPQAGGCSSNPSLPAGLAVAVHLGSCRISGTAPETAGTTTYTITAINATGSSGADVAITVRVPLAPNLLAPTAPVLVEGVSITSAIVVSNSDASAGAAIADEGCDFYDGADALTATAAMSNVQDGFELSTASNTCRLTGTPSSEGENTLYIGAISVEGALDIVSLVITVSEPAPQLADPADETVILGQVVGLVLTNSGGAPENNGCSHDVALPTGLALGLDSSATTCEISGTVDASATLGETDIVITASNAAGMSSVTLTLTVAPATPVLPASHAASVDEGESLGTITLANSGGAIVGCAFETLDPNDNSMSIEVMSLNGLSVAVGAGGASCEISGTPVGGPGMESYVVVATNAAGSDSADLDLTINVAAPALEVGPLARNAVDGLAIDGVLLANDGSALTACNFVDPDDSSLVSSLDGLSIVVDTSTRNCDVTGTLDLDNGASQSFTARATNSAGSDDIVIVFTVAQAAPDLPAGPLSYSVVDGADIGAIAIANSGGDIDANGCAFLDGSNMIIDESTLTISITAAADGCTLGGTLSGVGMQSFTVGAQNGSGADSVVVNFTVNPSAPDLDDIVVAINVVDGEAISETLVSNDGGDPSSCAFVDPSDQTGMTTSLTLDGLSVAVAMDESDCAINGTLSGVGSKSFTVRASNVTGDSDATVPFTVYAADWVVLDSSGIATPNVLSVSTSAMGDFSDAVETTGPMASAKTTWMLDSNSGVLSVSVSSAAGAAELLTRLNPVVDLSGYAAGEIVFEIVVADYLNYTEMKLRIDCDGCTAYEHSLGTPGDDDAEADGDNDWETVRVSIATLVANGLDLENVSAGLVIYPDKAQQSGETLGYMLRNVRWESLSSE